MSGLRKVPSETLQDLLLKLESKRLAGPLTKTALERAGFKKQVAALLSLGPLQTDALAALLKAVMAERSAPTPGLELVWTGPDAMDSTARSTAIVVRDLFLGARKSVLIAGYTFDHPKEILQPLHQSMVAHHVDVEIYIDVGLKKGGPAPTREELRDRFLLKSWPFGGHIPRLYADSRALEGDWRTSLHAKCLVVDDTIAFVSSANFTDRGHHRNVETGVLVRAPGFARDLSAHFRKLSHSHAFEAL